MTNVVSRMRSRVLSMSVENWKAIFDAVGVIAVLLALIAGTGVLWTGNIINERQSAQLRAFDKAVTDAKILLEQERIRRLELEALVEPRSVRLTKRAIERLAAERGTALQIEYRSGDEEAHRLAGRIGEAARWAGWGTRITSSGEADFKSPFRELREGVEITGGPNKLPPNADLAKLPTNGAAIKLWEFLRANGVSAKLYVDASHLSRDWPIVVRVWSRPLPYSRDQQHEGLTLLSKDASWTQGVKAIHDENEKLRLEENERLRKEWYPDGQQ
jgi:hypothetical protein